MTGHTALVRTELLFQSMDKNIQKMEDALRRLQELVGEDHD